LNFVYELEALFFWLFVSSSEVGSLAPIVVVMLPEALALVRWRSI